MITVQPDALYLIYFFPNVWSSQDPLFVWYFESQDPQSLFSIPNLIHYPLNKMGSLSIQLVRHPVFAVPLCALRESAPSAAPGYMDLHEGLANQGDFLSAVIQDFFSQSHPVPS